MAQKPLGPPALEAPVNPAPSKGVAGVIARWFANRGAPAIVARPGQRELAPAVNLEDNWDDWIADPVSMQFLAGTINRQLRSRQQIYEKWQEMIADPVISAALRLHVTSALGGDEATGQMLFIEPTPEAKKDKAKLSLVESIATDLQVMLNRMAPGLCFNAAAFGDAYGRIYSEPRKGVLDVYTGELVYPPVVQPYERADTTIGYTVATGQRFNERLSVLQMARMKMPRLMYIPQNRVIEKAIRIALTTDQITSLPAVPALAGGSLLDGAETPYDKFTASWAGLTGQRVQDSVDESIVTVQQTGMTPQQRQKFKDSLTAMFQRSNDYINAVVRGGRSVFGRVWHFIPTSNDKQVTRIDGAATPGRTSSLTIDDVMMNARFLAGALGMDLSMLGFADQLGGGLGEGGFFRISAQSAERSRSIRTALTPFVNHVISVHVLMKHGLDFEGQEIPWHVNYHSSISALESERAKTKRDAMDSGAVLIQTIQQLKELGWDKATMQNFLEREMSMEARDAKMYADAIFKAAEQAKKDAAAGGGGFGGGDDGGAGGQITDPAGPDPED